MTYTTLSVIRMFFFFYLKYVCTTRQKMRYLKKIIHIIWNKVTTDDLIFITISYVVVVVVFAVFFCVCFVCKEMREERMKTIYKEGNNNNNNNRIKKLR